MKKRKNPNEILISDAAQSNCAGFREGMEDAQSEAREINDF